MGVRGTVEAVGKGGVVGFVLGPAWQRDWRVTPGDEVTVVLEPEGPQRGDLAPDVAAALEAEPAAGAFFDALAQFYRNEDPEVDRRHRRGPTSAGRGIEEMVRLLVAGHKERPRR